MDDDKKMKKKISVKEVAESRRRDLSIAIMEGLKAVMLFVLGANLVLYDRDMLWILSIYAVYGVFLFIGEQFRGNSDVLAKLKEKDFAKARKLETNNFLLEISKVVLMLFVGMTYMYSFMISLGLFAGYAIMLYQREKLSAELK